MSGSIKGSVVGQDGVVVAGASVVIAAGPGPAPDLAAVSSESGDFVLDGLAPGVYRLEAFGPQGETGQASVTVSRDEGRDVVIEVSGSGER